jgi:hypothetical protein
MIARNPEFSKGMDDFMLIQITVLLATMTFGEVFQTEEVSIKVDIQSSIYTYEVTNLSTDKIVGFEVRFHAAYNFKVPVGWHEQVTGGIFKAWTDDAYAGISQNQTAQFSDRVSSQGAVLGSSPVKVHFQSGKTVIVPDVWAPVHEPQSYIFLIAAAIICIMCLHTAVIIYRKKHNR